MSKTTRMRISTAGLAAGLIALTGCSMGDAGVADAAASSNQSAIVECIGETPSNRAYDYAIVSLDGDTVTYKWYGCDDELYDDDTSVGTLNESRTEIIWTQEGEMSGTDTVTIVDSAVSVDGENFVLRESGAGKALYDNRVVECAAD